MMERQPNTEYIAYISYGKDSCATLEAIRILGYPLDRIIHAEVWATDTIHADLPPMLAFKAEADRIIKERYGIEVEHVCAMNKDGTKKTYEQLFYHIPKRRAKAKDYEGLPSGFPAQKVGGGETVGVTTSNSIRWTNQGISTNCRSHEMVQTSQDRYLRPNGFPISINRGQYCQKLKRVF